MHRCTSRDVRTPVPPPRCQIRWTDRLYARTDGGCNQRGERQPPRGTWRVLLSPATGTPTWRRNECRFARDWALAKRSGEPGRWQQAEAVNSTRPPARTHARTRRRPSKGRARPPASRARGLAPGAGRGLRRSRGTAGAAERGAHHPSRLIHLVRCPLRMRPIAPVHGRHRRRAARRRQCIRRQRRKCGCLHGDSAPTHRTGTVGGLPFRERSEDSARRDAWHEESTTCWARVSARPGRPRHESRPGRSSAPDGRICGAADWSQLDVSPLCPNGPLTSRSGPAVIDYTVRAPRLG